MLESLFLVALTALPASAGSKRKTISVVTFNIHKGGLGLDEKVDLERVALVVKGKAEIAGFQEVDRFAERSGKVDEAVELSYRAAFGYHAFGLCTRPHRGRWEYGNLLASKRPIKSSRTVALPTGKAEDGKPDEPRCAVVGDLGDLRVIVTHLSTDAKIRAKQAKAVSQLARSLEKPVILMGDMNSAPDEGGLETIVAATLKQGMTDQTEGAPPTFPADKPKTRIDYILTKGVDAGSVRVEPTEASDHRPVFFSGAYQSR